MATSRGPTPAKTGTAPTPDQLPTANLADFVFSEPFRLDNDRYVPPSQRVPSVGADRAIFVDNASGMWPSPDPWPDRPTCLLTLFKIG